MKANVQFGLGVKCQSTKMYCKLMLTVIIHVRLWVESNMLPRNLLLNPWAPRFRELLEAVGSLHTGWSSLVLYFPGCLCSGEWASRESLEWNLSIREKWELTHRCGVGGAGGSGDSISLPCQARCPLLTTLCILWCVLSHRGSPLWGRGRWVSSWEKMSLRFGAVNWLLPR